MTTDAIDKRLTLVRRLQTAEDDIRSGREGMSSIIFLADDAYDLLDLVSGDTIADGSVMHRLRVRSSKEAFSSAISLALDGLPAK